MKIRIEESRIFEGCTDMEEAKLALVNTIIEGSEELAEVLKKDSLDVIENMCISAINSVKRERKNRRKLEKERKNSKQVGFFLNFKLKEGK